VEKGSAVIKFIHPVEPSEAKGLVADVYAQIKRDFGRVAEPFMMHSPSPNLLAGAWMACRETELVGTVPRATKEAVAATVSQLNRCQYCVDAHTIMLSATGEGKAAKAIAKADYAEIPDQKMFDAVKWTLATNSPKSEDLEQPPFTPQEAPEVIGTAVFYHYINRMATVLLGGTPLPSSQGWLKAPLKGMASHMFSEAVHRPKNIGDSLQFLPEANLPGDLHWAQTNPNLAAAYARFAAAVEKAGESALPVAARRFVKEEISEWDGKASELNLAWSEETISKFDEATQAAARLALLTALAPNEVDAEIIAAFSKHFPGDDKLVAALAWASLTAARKIGTWLQPPKLRGVAQAPAGSLESSTESAASVQRKQQPLRS